MNAIGNGITGGAFRVDHLAIAEMVPTGSRVLDVGCGDGELLKLLELTCSVDGRGIEISQRGVNECVAKSLNQCVPPRYTGTRGGERPENCWFSGERQYCCWFQVDQLPSKYSQRQHVVDRTDAGPPQGKV